MVDIEWPERGTDAWEALVERFDELIGYRAASMLEYIGPGRHHVTRKDLTGFNRAFFEYLQDGSYRDGVLFEYGDQHFSPRVGECEEILKELAEGQLKVKLSKAGLYDVAWLAIEHGIRDMEALSDAKYVLYQTDFSDMPHLREYILNKPAVVTCLYEALGTTYNRLQLGAGYVLDDPEDVWGMVETLADTFKSLSEAYFIFTRIEMNYEYVEPWD